MSLERRGAAIEIAHSRKQYGNGSHAGVALDDINLRVARGRVPPHRRSERLRQMS